MAETDPARSEVAPPPDEGLVDQRPLLGRRSIWVDLLLYPTHSLPTAAAPVLIGLGLAAHDGVLAPGPALVAFLGSWLIHVAGVFTDNHELLRLHPEVIEHPELTEAVRGGTLRIRTLTLATLACLLAALLTVPWLLALGGAPVLLLGVIGVAASLCYAGGPLAYARRGLADLVFLLMFGAVAVAGTYYIQAAARGALQPGLAALAALPARVWLVGLPSAGLVVSVMLIDDLRDQAFDRRKGWRTGSVRFGEAFTVGEITGLAAVALLGPLGLWLGLGLGAWVLLPLLCLPLGWRTVQAVRRARGRRSELVPLTPRMARLALVQAALLGLGLALAAPR
jgi:1,4-dihydroxy-2-naphthoate octaprenyltransferase